MNTLLRVKLVPWPRLTIVSITFSTQRRHAHLHIVIWIYPAAFRKWALCLSGIQFHHSLFFFSFFLNCLSSWSLSLLRISRYRILCWKPPKTARTHKSRHTGYLLDPFFVFPTPLFFPLRSARRG